MAASWADKDGLVVAVEKFSPRYEVYQVSLDNLMDATSEDGEIRRLSLHRDAPDVSMKSEREFLSANPDLLTILIGEEREGMLFESMLGSTSDDAQMGKVWRRIRDRARKSMYKGAWVKSRLSGGGNFDASHAYTPGPLALQGQGAEMVGINDGTIYLLNSTEG
ncbi:hypothetical protein GCM10009744_27760 [Kribbella alba]|uniref:Uncharacterized protein n=1 Tax=Kribbella alba TaxID=190197 RepID=A0ABN2FA23_9ACTN